MTSFLNKTNSQYDVIIAGGGVNGVGIARDCACVVCLVCLSKKRFSAGTSWASSGMIHGGPRYMLGDLDVTRLACLDSGYIQKIAPHLLFRIPFLYSVYDHKNEGLKRRLYLEAVEAFSAYDRFVPLKWRAHTRLSRHEVLKLEPNLPKDKLLGAVTFDEWGIDVPRLCVANVLDAVQNGAHALNHTIITKVNCENNQFQSVALKDQITGETKTVSGKILINATGPWSPEFAKLMGVNIKLRGGKGVHLVFDRRLFNMAIVSQAIDGREIFVMPYENTSIIGTTDDDYFGDLDDQRTTDDEIAYLIEGIAQVFPDIQKAKMIHSYSGVRPTIYDRDCYEDDLSREHETLDHEKRDGKKGMISLIGGKLASYRIMAEEVTDLICKKLNHQTACSTHTKFLPGGESLPDAVELAKEFQVNAFAVSRLIYRHGSLAEQILQQTQSQPELKNIICGCEPVTLAEIKYVKDKELVRTLSDIKRRTRLSWGPCQGTNCSIAAAGVFSDLMDLDAQETESAHFDFLSEWWPNRAAVINGEQLKQEELFQALHFCNN
ncbi:MAG: glycerol-3-phosphate dehydrogenase/oxidase [Deltaproteobacteria bacterium]|nr:glycerol-3-phosphate dehydrogenase/oxidase [Deltaproteobacteria bacterium]